MEFQVVLGKKFSVEVEDSGLRKRVHPDAWEAVLLRKGGIRYG
jgi:hypothetical protein